MISCEEKSPTRLCPFSVLVQHFSGDGDEGDFRWISMWTTNWRAHSHEPLLRWWHHHDGHFGGSTIQKLVYRLDRVSRKYSVLINVDKTKVMASDGIACRILIQNEQLELQVDRFTYLGSLITKDGECMAEFSTRLNRGQAIGTSLQKIRKSHCISISTKIRLMTTLVWVWPVAKYCCESLTLRKNEELRLDAIEMKGLRKILREFRGQQRTMSGFLTKLE